MSVTCKIVVLCGGKFALPALQLLAHEQYLAGIAIGKGEVSVVSAIRHEAENSNIPFQSFNRKEELSRLAAWIREINPDAIFSICFPFLISPEVLGSCKGKFINFHTGSLPQFRGPMPIFEALRYGEKQTELSIHFMNEEFDEGPLILKEPIGIDKNETFGSLAKKLSKRAALAALSLSEMLEFATDIPTEKQDEQLARYFEFPESTDTLIRWDKMPAEEIDALIRACNPWNSGADANLKGQAVKILEAAISEEPHTVVPGQIIGLDESGNLCVACLNNKQLRISILGSDYGILSARQFTEKENIIHYAFN